MITSKPQALDAERFVRQKNGLKLGYCDFASLNKSLVVVDGERRFKSAE